jgi:hypothetical protein
MTVGDGGNSKIRLKVDPEPNVTQEDSLNFLSQKARLKQEFT